MFLLLTIMVCGVGPCRAMSFLSALSVLSPSASSSGSNAMMPSQSTSANPPFTPAIRSMLVIEPPIVGDDAGAVPGREDPLLLDPDAAVAGGENDTLSGGGGGNQHPASASEYGTMPAATLPTPESNGTSGSQVSTAIPGARHAGKVANVSSGQPNGADGGRQLLTNVGRSASNASLSARPIVPIPSPGFEVKSTRLHPANYIRGPKLPPAASSSAASSSANLRRGGSHASANDEKTLAAAAPGAIPASTTTESPQDDYAAVQVGTHCESSEETTASLGWNETEGGVVAAQPCPGGYQGLVYRPCYNSGLWGASDYTDCRLERLANIRNLIYYHLHNNLIEGLYHLADDLARYLAAADMRSPMDRLDTMDTLNAVLQTKLALRLRNGFDIAFVQSLLESVNEILSKKTVEFTSESRKVSLLTAKTGEMVMSLSAFVDTALAGFRLSDLKEVALSASENIMLNLRRKQLKEQPVLIYTNDSQITTVKLADDYPSGSVRAVLVLRGLGTLLNNDAVVLDSDLLVVSFLPPSQLSRAATNLSTHFDVTMNYRQRSQASYMTIECASVWNSTWLWSKENCHLVSQTDRTATCRCLQSGNVATVLRKTWLKERPMIPHRVSIVMTGGCVVCLTAVVLTFVVYVCNMRREISENSIIKMNLLMSVGFIQIVYIAGVNATSIRELCYSVALVLHYLFLVASFWMLSYGMHLHRRLRSSSVIAAACPPAARNWPALRPRTRLYCLMSWALPGMLVLLSFLVNPRGYEIRRYCWLSIQRGMLLSFIVPISILIVVNTTLMVLVLRCFFAQKPVTHKSDIEKIRCALRAGVVLLPLLAVNWFFGVLSLENTATTIFEGVFACTNSLLGILLFVFYCSADPEIRCTWDVEAWLRSRRCRPSAAKSAVFRLRKSCTFSSQGRSSSSCAFAQAAIVCGDDCSPRSDAQPLLFCAPSLGPTPASMASNATAPMPDIRPPDSGELHCHKACTEELPSSAFLRV